MTKGDIVPLRGKYSDQLAATVVGLVRDGLSIRATCAKLGLSRSTVTDWLVSHPDFAEQVRVAREEAIEARRRLAKGPGTRPQTPERVEAVITALVGGASQSAAAAAAGVHIQTLERWIEADADFRLLIEGAEAKCQERALDQIRAAAEEPRFWTAAAWLLERRWPQVFARRFEIPYAERVRTAAKLGSGLADALVKGLSEAGLEPDQQERVRRLLAEELDKATQAG